MPIGGIGQLTAADENFNHQIADTFATVVESDRSWTEKTWAALTSRDGSLQIDFGLGSYRNRSVHDGHAGVSRGREQWTVRASRETGTDLSPAIGPIGYEVINPLGAVRFSLDDNDACDIAFDVTFTAALPPFFEDRNSYRDANGRISANVVRFHQAGDVTGWLRIGSERHAIEPGTWFGFRDRSWGVRGENATGLPLTDLAPVPVRALSADSEIPSLMHWTPWLLENPDGSRYGVHFLLSEVAGFRFIESAYVNHPDGRQERVRVRPELEYDRQTRFPLGGAVHLDLSNGQTKTVEIEPLGDTGFFLRPAGYGDWGGHRHGVWRGALVVDGEHIADCQTPEALNALGQFRDKPVRVTDGQASGFGIYETIVTGVWPQLDLTAESNYGGY